MSRSRREDPAEDVESYVRARWGGAVAVLVELGASVEEAEAAARAAALRSWGRWPRERRSGDVDELVFGELLEAWGWPERHPEIGADRVARALVAQGRVSEWVAERLTGGDPGAVPLAPWVPEDDTAYRGAAPIAELHDELRRRRHRRRRTTAVVTAGVLVVAGLAGVVRELSAEDPPEQRPEVVNPLPLAWWSQGTLHLGRTELPVPGLVELAQAGSGSSYAVVYGDEAGRVFQVDDASDPVQVGETVPGSQLRATDDGRAAWVDVTDPAPAVVVWDTGAREEVDRLALSEGASAQVVALTDDTVHLGSPAGTRRWALGETRAESIPERVLDASGAVLLVARAGADPVIAGSSGRFVVATDHRATLAQDGVVAAAWVPRQPELMLAGLGANLTTVPLDLPQRSGVLDVRFAADGTLVLVFAQGPGTRRGGGEAGGEARVSVATCVLHTGACAEVEGLEGLDGQRLVLTH